MCGLSASGRHISTLRLVLLLNSTHSCGYDIVDVVVVMTEPVMHTKFLYIVEFSFLFLASGELVNAILDFLREEKTGAKVESL